MCASLQHLHCCSSANNFSLTVCPEAHDSSGQVEYPDDFEEAEVEEEDEDEAAISGTVTPKQLGEEALEEEFQLCDAGGLMVTLKALKDKTTDTSLDPD